jgi:hypothetical protein
MRRLLRVSPVRDFTPLHLLSVEPDTQRRPCCGPCVRFSGFVTAYNYRTHLYGTQDELNEDTFRNAWFTYNAFICAHEIGHPVGDISRFVKSEFAYDGKFEAFLDALLRPLSVAFEDKWSRHDPTACGIEHRLLVGDGHVRYSIIIFIRHA